MSAIASSSNVSTSPPLGRTQKTLTPQRKHRKMLKDGSSEVWPESIEEIFVQGLRRYWASPWATFSRGRSRWRNQFLVDYLRERGIERSKKQVASHIQVLRNMWKGEPEYQLVAGGDELFVGIDSPTSGNTQDADQKVQPSGVTVKEERDGHLPLLFPPSPSSSGSDNMYDSYKASDLYSPVIASPMRDDFVNSPATAIDAPTNVPFAISPAVEVKHKGVDIPGSDYMNSYPAQAVEHWPAQGATQDSNPIAFLPPSNTEFLGAAPTAKFLPPTSPEPVSLHRNRQIGVPVRQEAPPGACQTISNRITMMCIWARNLDRCIIPVDNYSPVLHSDSLNPGAVIIRVKVHLPVLRSGSCNALQFEGFQGAVDLNSPWTSAQCTTEIYGAEPVLPETLPLRLYQNVDTQTTRCLLPDSWLSKSSWLDPARPTCVYQHIVVDGVTLAVIRYDFEGVYSDKPSAMVQEVHRVPMSGKPSSQPLPMVSQYISGNSQPTVTNYVTPLQSPPSPFYSSSYPSVGRLRSGTTSSTLSVGSQRF